MLDEFYTRKKGLELESRAGRWRLEIEDGFFVSGMDGLAEKVQRGILDLYTAGTGNWRDDRVFQVGWNGEHVVSNHHDDSEGCGQK